MRDATTHKIDQPQVGTGGVAHTMTGAYAHAEYSDATYVYYGDALPGTALTAATWRVSRKTSATNRIMWADGNGKFDNVFTDLATVAALSFS